MGKSKLDVVGIGLNATDTLYSVPEFPALGGKQRVFSVSEQAGGQVSTALVTCQRLGLATRYIGSFGDDCAGRLQRHSLVLEGVDLRYSRRVPGVANQFGCIVVDRSTGERTVFWGRDSRLTLKASLLPLAALEGARLLLIDGCDLGACLKAAKWARRAGVPVLADLDTKYPKIENLLVCVDYLIAAREFLAPATGREDPFAALEVLHRDCGVRVPGVTLGHNGALLLWQGWFLYSPGFKVKAVDTTGAGDVFHGAFAYGILAGWDMHRALDLANAMAALNCTALGARGRIGPLQAAERLIATGVRRVHRTYAARSRQTR